MTIFVTFYEFIKFSQPKEDIEAFLSQIERQGLLVSAGPLKIRLPDPDDEAFLEIALSAGVAARVTGKKRHFSKKEFEGGKTYAPAEFRRSFPLS